MRTAGFLLVLYVVGVVLIGAWFHARAPSMQADVDRTAGKHVHLRTVRRFLYMTALVWPGALFCWAVVSLISPLIKLLKLLAPKKMNAVAKETLQDLSKLGGAAGAIRDIASASLVSEIRIEVVSGGKRKVVVFVRKEKIEDLMLAQGSVGDLLQSIATDDAIDTLQ